MSVPQVSGGRTAEFIYGFARGEGGDRKDSLPSRTGMASIPALGGLMQFVMIHKIWMDFL